MKKNTKSLSQKTADKIYEMIVKEQCYQSGDQLPNEFTLAQQLEVSRTTLRDAVRILTLQGVLEVRRGKGTFVTSDPWIVGNYGLDQFDRIRIRLKDLFEMRLLFEPQVVALACRRGSEEEINAICHQGALVTETIKQGKPWTTVDQEFHRLLIMAAHNDFMNHLIPLIYHAIDEAIMIGADKETLSQNTIEDHRLIMEFLQKRDAQAAKNAMEIHIHHAIHTLNLNKETDAIF